LILGPHHLQIVCELAAVTFLIGLLIGFVGAGGAGVAVAILTTAFDLPAHAAIGTAIAAMFFVTISGTISHLREGNVALQIGLVVGPLVRPAQYWGRTRVRRLMIRRWRWSHA